VVVDDERGWPTDKLNALRLGHRLVAEVPAGAPGRRAFVSIRPATGPEDAAAGDAGWTRSSRSRSFHVDHWEYDQTWLDTWDYDIGATHLHHHHHAANEAELSEVVNRLGLAPADFDYPWNTADPR
jgi:hypothetical protein